MKIVFLVLLVGVVCALAQDNSTDADAALWGITRRVDLMHQPICFQGHRRLAGTTKCVVQREFEEIDPAVELDVFKPHVHLFAKYTEREVFDSYKFEIENAWQRREYGTFVYEAFTYSTQELADLFKYHETWNCDKPHHFNPEEKLECRETDHYDVLTNTCYRFSKMTPNACTPGIMHLFRPFAMQHVAEWKPVFTRPSDLHAYYNAIDKAQHKLEVVHPDAHVVVPYKPYRLDIPYNRPEAEAIMVQTAVLCGVIIATIVVCVGARKMHMTKTISIKLKVSSGIKSVLKIDFGPDDQLIDVFAKVPDYMIVVGRRQLLPRLRDNARRRRFADFRAIPWPAECEKRRLKILARAQQQQAAPQDEQE